MHPCHIMRKKIFFIFTGDQYKWLERDLANVNRKVTPWLVAVWHPPWYSSYKAHYREAECMRVAMEEILYKNGVDIVFNGHVSLFNSTAILCILASCFCMI